MKRLSTTIVATTTVAFCMAAAHAPTPAVLKATDRLSPLPAGSARIEGHLGRKLDVCIRNGVMAKDDSLYVKPFALRNDDPDKWQGEFWGKW